MYKVLIAMSTLVLASPALAGFNSGSDGTDLELDCGALIALNPECGPGPECNQACTVQINLGLAATGDWDTPIPPEFAGQGIYDPQQWAVVFKYTTINIPAGVTVTFVNHRKGAPVVWLATGNVTIAGTVELNGANGVSGDNAPGFSRASPGPGGFSGGIGRLGGSAGFGPGGGGSGNNGGGGGYGTPGATGGNNPGLGGDDYGTDSIDPLIGGSGGGADTDGGGGAGGGAILIASSESITLNSPGGIFAKGGEGFDSCCGGSGSGGGIRLIANQIWGSDSGLLQALGGTFASDGGDGRIRLEAPNPDNDIHLAPTMPLFTEGPSPAFVFPPPEAPAPILRVATINGIPVPTDPQATVATGDVAFTADFSVAIEIELLNMPEAAGMLVNVRVVQADGGASEVVQSMPLADDGMGALTAEAVFDFTSPGNWEVQLSLLLP